MEKIHEKTTRYALVLALATHTRCQNGRLRGLLGRLEKEANRNISKLPFLNNSDIKICVDRIMAFEKEVGWDKNDKKHVLTFANFLLGVLDDAPPEFDRIIAILREVVDYFERVGTVPAPCYWGGARAASIFIGSDR